MTGLPATSESSRAAFAAGAAWLFGLWLGGSAVVWAIGYHNFAGLPRLLARNAALAQRAGFDPADEAAMRSSLLWVHASEQNRVLFETWNWAQLAIGAAAVAIAIGLRQGFSVLFGCLALALVAYLSLRIVPELVRQGRALDFMPRSPKPAGLEDFGRIHLVSICLDLLRGTFVALAVVPLLRRRAAS